MKRFGQIVLAILIVIKLVLGTIFISHLDFNAWFGQNAAIASESQAATLAPAPAAAATPESAATVKTSTDTPAPAFGPPSGDMAALEQKKKELLAIQADINQKIETLRKLRSEIKSEVSHQKAVEEGKLKHLIKVYSAMKPQKAATLVEKLDLPFAIQLLSQMKGDVVGNILSFVDTEKAARISQELIKPE